MKEDLLAIEGFNIHELTTIEDSRGNLTEIFRESWYDEMQPLQWNFVRSRANVMRGFHVHHTHSDYLILLEGHMRLGIKDLRPDSSTFGRSGVIDWRGDEKKIINIQPGIGHGFYFPVPSLLTYGLSSYWDFKDELGCMWDDPELDIEWGVTSRPPLLSDRDETAMSFNELMTIMTKK